MDPQDQTNGTPPVDASPAPVTPKYVTEEELQAKLEARIKELEPELENRAFAKAQSRSQKTENRIKKELDELKKHMARPEIVSRLGEEEARAAYLEMRADVVADAFAAEEEPEPPASPPASTEMPPQAIAYVDATLETLDVDRNQIWGTDLDPRLPKYRTPQEWNRAVRQYKAQSLKPNPPPAPAPAPSAPTEPVAMDMGGGPAAGTSDPLARLSRDFKEARSMGDIAKMERIANEMTRLGK